jgi:hypothetical protein
MYLCGCSRGVIQLEMFILLKTKNRWLLSTSVSGGCGRNLLSPYAAEVFTFFLGVIVNFILKCITRTILAIVVVVFFNGAFRAFFARGDAS